MTPECVAVPEPVPAADKKTVCAHHNLLFRKVSRVIRSSPASNLLAVPSCFPKSAPIGPDPFHVWPLVPGDPTDVITGAPTGPEIFHNFNVPAPGLLISTRNIFCKL